MIDIPEILLALVALVIGAFWIFFPLFVNAKLKKVIEQNEHIITLLNVIANHTAPPGRTATVTATPPDA